VVYSIHRLKHLHELVNYYSPNKYHKEGNIKFSVWELLAIILTENVSYSLTPSQVICTSKYDNPIIEWLSGCSWRVYVYSLASWQIITLHKTPTSSFHSSSKPMANLVTRLALYNNLDSISSSLEFKFQSIRVWGKVASVSCISFRETVTEAEDSQILCHYNSSEAPSLSWPKNDCAY